MPVYIEIIKMSKNVTNTKNYKYFSKNIKNKIINNSTNNIHNLSNKDMIKIHKDSSQKKYSNNNSSRWM